MDRIKNQSPRNTSVEIAFEGSSRSSDYTMSFHYNRTGKTPLEIAAFQRLLEGRNDGLLRSDVAESFYADTDAPVAKYVFNFTSGKQVCSELIADGNLDCPDIVKTQPSATKVRDQILAVAASASLQLKHTTPEWEVSRFRRGIGHWFSGLTSTYVVDSVKMKLDEGHLLINFYSNFAAPSYVDKMAVGKELRIVQFIHEPADKKNPPWSVTINDRDKAGLGEIGRELTDLASTINTRLKADLGWTLVWDESTSADLETCSTAESE